MVILILYSLLIMDSFLLFKTGTNLCVILITQVPWEKFRRYPGITEPIQLYFPEYSKNILSCSVISHTVIF